MHYKTVALETWEVIAGRGAHAPGSPLNVPPVLASNFVLGGERAYARDDGTPRHRDCDQCHYTGARARATHHHRGMH